MTESESWLDKFLSKFDGSKSIGEDFRGAYTIVEEKIKTLIAENKITAQSHPDPGDRWEKHLETEAEARAIYLEVAMQETKARAALENSTRGFFRKCYLTNEIGKRLAPLNLRATEYFAEQLVGILEQLDAHSGCQCVDGVCDPETCPCQNKHGKKCSANCGCLGCCTGNPSEEKICPLPFD